MSETWAWIGARRDEKAVIKITNSAFRKFNSTNIISTVTKLGIKLPIGKTCQSNRIQFIDEQLYVIGDGYLHRLRAPQ